MLAVKEDEDYPFRIPRTGVVSQLFYRFMMPHPRRTRVVSQLVKAGAALDLQDKVNYSNIIHYLIYLACLAETDVTMVVIAISALD